MSFHGKMSLDILNRNDLLLISQENFRVFTAERHNTDSEHFVVRVHEYETGGSGEIAKID